MKLNAHNREQCLAEVLQHFWTPPTDGDQLLIIGDRERRLAGRFSDGRVDVREWCRWASGQRTGTAWPPAGLNDVVALRLPRDKSIFRLQLAAISHRINPSGSVWVYGANDEGVRSAKKVLADYYDHVESMGSKRHCRVWRATGPTIVGTGTIAEHLSTHQLELASGAKRWHHLPGVFADGQIDAATALLLRALTACSPPATVLDFACGGGVISAELQERWPHVQLTGSDADALALEVARLNLPGQELISSDGWSKLHDRRFDLIVSNPPIHRGRDEDHSVLEALIRSSPRHLTKSGELWLVGQKRLNLKRLYARLEVEAHLRSEDGRFQVWSST